MQLCAVRDAYFAGVRADDMADQPVMVALSTRYRFKLAVFQPPTLDALEVAEGRLKRNQHLRFRPYSVGAADVQQMRGNPATAMVLATNVGARHFEPIVPISGATQRPGRFTHTVQRQETAGWCPVLDISYTTDQQRREVRSSCTHVHYLANHVHLVSWCIATVPRRNGSHECRRWTPF